MNTTGVDTSSLPDSMTSHEFTTGPLKEGKPSPYDETTSTGCERRVDQTLDRLDELTSLLSDDAGFPVPELPYDIPSDFRLSVVIPVYNERETIGPLLARVHALPLPLELVIVDDHSTDGTVEVLEFFEAVDQVQVIYKSQNEGKGAALRTGFQHVTGDVVVVQDADLEYDPRDLLKLLAPLLDGEADVVYGSRFLEDNCVNSSWLHQAGNRWLTRASNLTTGWNLTDMETCYKLIRRELLSDLELQQDRFGFEPEITAKLARRGARVCELPIGYEARTWDEGKKIGIRDGLNSLYCIARYAFRD